jgi:hypothetical protein
MEEGFWFGLGLIGAVGAAIGAVVVLILALMALNEIGDALSDWKWPDPERKAKRMRDKGYANLDGK